MSEQPILIFTDGASSGNPGPGGWGTIVAHPDGWVAELGGGEKRTTNNRMEMTAVVEGLRLLEDVPGPVRVHLDSDYVRKGITSWVWGWSRKGWKTATGKPVLNQEIWEAMAALVQERGRKSLEWVLVPGHRGIPGNERCDQIASGYATGKPPELYRGGRDDYPVDLKDLEPKGAPPSRGGAKGKGRKSRSGKAYSYLSLVDGQVRRHRSWPECESRVRGISGARFKKALSRADEREIVESWGFRIGEVG